MKRENFKNKKSKVVGTTKIKIRKVYISSSYQIKGMSDTFATETGLVTIAKLSPKTNSLPEFILRWDTNAEELDIDVYQSGKNAKYLWKKQGYRGHKTKELETEGRVFEVNIKIPSHKVFSGSVDVDLQSGLKLTDSATIEEHVDVEILNEKDK